MRLLSIILTMLSCGINLRANDSTVPLYIYEFSSKLGINSVSLRGELSIQKDIQQAVIHAGFGDVLANAQSAKDEYTNAPYFLIKKENDEVIIGKKYVLDKKYVIAELYLKKDAEGNFYKALFMQSMIE